MPSDTLKASGPTPQSRLPRPRSGPDTPQPAEAPDRDDEYRDLMPGLIELAGLAEDDPRRAALRKQLITGFSPVADHLARRFVHRGEPFDDLRQVALLGLIHAVDRFDPDFGGSFLAFAVPTIRGELRRHFRDQGWSMRVPRRLKDLYLTVNAATAELSQRLQEPPGPDEIAEHLGISREEVVEGLQAAQAYRCDSLDKPVNHDEPLGPSLGEAMGGSDPELDLVEATDSVRPLLDQLPERERTIIALRFYGNQTQSRIAERVGVSQMQVSRLLTQTLDRLREQLQPS